MDEIVEKNINSLKSIATPNNQLPLFNGSTEINLDSYFNLMKALNYKFKKNQTKIGNLQIIKYKKNYTTPHKRTLMIVNTVKKIINLDHYLLSTLLIIKKLLQIVVLEIIFPKKLNF